jgi:DNA mismatch repair protein MutS2
MKSYAQSTAGVACGSFGYDPDTYEPDYRLTLGRAGRSLALEMAERLGLPPGIAADARSRMDDKQAQAEALMKKLEEQEALVRKEAVRIEESRRALQAGQERLAEAERGIEAARRTRADAFARELAKRGEEAARRMADAVGEAVRRVEAARAAQAAAGRARTEAVRVIREAQEQALEGIRPAPSAEAPPAIELAAGVRVKVANLGVAGEVLSLGDHGDAEVAVGGKRLRVPRRELVPVAAAAPGPGGRPFVSPQRSAASGSGRGGAPVEVNVVGMTVDEALPRVDKALDQAVMAERREVRVIHGFGQGRLRRAVAELLDGHPHVASFRAGGPREGGGGATVVELKE